MEELKVLQEFTPFWVVVYYFIMWGFNTLFYVTGGVSLVYISRWYIHETVRNWLRKAAFVLLLFGAIRFTSGIIALVLFTNGTQNRVETIEFLGVISLALNTGFIGTIATLSATEAYALYNNDFNRRSLLLELGEAFNKMKEVSQNHNHAKE